MQIAMKIAVYVLAARQLDLHFKRRADIIILFMIAKLFSLLYDRLFK